MMINPYLKSEKQLEIHQPEKKVWLYIEGRLYIYIFILVQSRPQNIHLDYSEHICIGWWWQCAF